MFMSRSKEVSDSVKIVKFLPRKYTNHIYFATIVILSIMRGEGSSYRLRLLVYRGFWPLVFGYADILITAIN